MAICAVYGCNSNNDKRLKRNIDESIRKSTKFFRFPKDENFKKIWIHKTRRKDKFKTETSYICSKHFTADDYGRNLKHELLNYSPPNSKKLKFDAVPSLNLLGSGSKTTIDTKRYKRQQKRNSRQTIQDLLMDVTCDNSEIIYDDSSNDTIILENLECINPDAELNDSILRQILCNGHSLGGTEQNINTNYSPPRLKNAIESIKEKQLFHLIRHVKMKLKQKSLPLEKKKKMLSEMPTDYAFKEIWNVVKPFSSTYMFDKVALACFKNILCEWSGWYGETNDSEIEMYTHLLEYLKFHLTAIIPHIETLANEYYLHYNSNSNHENIIEVECSLRYLKSLFYFEPNDLIIYDNSSVLHVHPLFTDSSNKYFLHWPHVSVRVKFPFFEMTRETINYNHFDVVNLNKIKEKPPVLRCITDTGLRYLESKDNKQFLPKFVISLITELIKLINVNKELCYRMKVEIKNILHEFLTDLALCVKTIDTCTTYYKHLTKYPYVRYLGKPAQNVPRVLMLDQLKTDSDQELNVRLRQVTYPAIKFSLDKLAVPYYDEDADKSKFIFCNDYLCRLKKNKCIVYKCTLCDEIYDSDTATHDLRLHLIKMHGYEPDWACNKCSCSFTTEFLAKNRWKHDCGVKMHRGRKIF